jgi:hypothetical protein
MSATSMPHDVDPSAWLLDCTSDLDDQAASRLVDLIYALGDHLAELYADRLRREHQRQRAEPLDRTGEPDRDHRQLDLFPHDLLEPF